MKIIFNLLFSIPEITSKFKFIISAITSFLNDLTPFLGTLKAAVALHFDLLQNVLKLPLLFYDTTPVGRVLSRFSKDVDVVDTGLSRPISDSVYCVFEVKMLFIIEIKIRLCISPNL